MTEKMTLYWQPKLRSVRIIWLIKEMGVEDDFEFIKFKPRENPADDATYRKDVHPHVTIPALVVPGRPPLLESGAICMYLADKYGKLVPDPKDRADYYDFIIYGNATLDELMDFFFYLKMEVSEAKRQKMRAKWDECMEYLAKRLEGKQYICGDTITAADCVIGYDLYLAADVDSDGELLKDHPKIRDYYSRLKARRAFKSTISKL